jgi:hypothetical protein
MGEQTIRSSFERQAGACSDLGSPFTAALCRLMAERLDRGSAFGRRILDWPGPPGADALPLRAAGALHALARRGCEPLARLYPPAPFPGPDALWAGVQDALASHDRELADFLDSPPQTNEVARSGVLLGGFLVLARETQAPLDVLEIGASAGLNMGFDSYAYELGQAGSHAPAGAGEDAPVRLACDWRGRRHPPLDAPLRVRSRAACDQNPLDPADPAARERLLAYVWPDQAQRLARLEAALDAAAAAPWRVEKADAADWVERRLAEPREPGGCRVLYHSIVWQYLPPAVQARIQNAMEEAGASASSEEPLAWLRLEADGDPRSAGLRLTLWPGGETRLLARGDFHGRWAEWL